MGIEARGQESLLRERVSGVSTGTRPGSEALRASIKGNYGSHFTKTAALIKESVCGSRGIAAPGKCSFGEL